MRLRRIDEAAAAKLLTAGRQLHTAAKLVDRPTVAVAGMLNSGKTSLVANFLSEQGRARTCAAPTTTRERIALCCGFPSVARR